MTCPCYLMNVRVLLFVLLLQNLVRSIKTITGFYAYQVAEVGGDIELHCLSSEGEHISWSRTRPNKQKESLLAPEYKVSTSYRCGNPHLCGGYDVEETKVCMRSTLTLTNLQLTDKATYFCQEGKQKGAYSFSYVLNVVQNLTPPHIYDFEPLVCNNREWYGCIASKNTVRYEYFIITKDGEKVTLHGEDQTKNSTVIGGNTLSFIIKQNYVTLQDFSILQQPSVKFGCRAYDSSGTFSEYKTEKLFEDIDPPPKEGQSYESYLIKMIGIGVGALAGMIILLVAFCKVRNRCGRAPAANDTDAQYTGLDHNNNQYTDLDNMNNNSRGVRVDEKV